MLLIAVVASAAMSTAPIMARPTVMSPTVMTQRIQPVTRPVTSTASPVQKPLTTPPHNNSHALQKAELLEPSVLDCFTGMRSIGRTCPSPLIVVP